MSKFINTQYKATVDSIVEGFKEKLKNPLYLHTDKKVIITDYFNQNSTMSTLDEASRIKYSSIGSTSPTKYNKISDACLYGDIDPISANYELGDFGLEVSSIEGELYTLPNTFIPVAEDYFVMKHLTQDILFKVTEVTIDTLDNGANFYKLSYKMDGYGKTKQLELQVVSNYKMIINNVGTNFKSVILSNDYDFIDNLELLLNRLKKYYQDLFFKNKVQTFIYDFDTLKFYDPFLIEFLIRNKILEGSDYVYVSHQTYTNSTFSIDYDRTFFRNMETKNKNIKNYIGQATIIKDPNSLMCVRLEDYFKVQYDGKVFLGNNIESIPSELVIAIQNNTKFTEEDKMIYNIIVDYFNDIQFNSEVISIIENIDYSSTHDLFYSIPLIIYILEYHIKTLLK